jgi:hypothetical protein
MMKLILYLAIGGLGFGAFALVKMNVDFKPEEFEMPKKDQKKVVKEPAKYTNSYIGNVYTEDNAIIKNNIFRRERGTDSETQTNKDVKLVGLCSMAGVKGAIIQEKVKEKITLREADRRREDRRAMFFRMMMMRGGASAFNRNSRTSSRGNSRTSSRGSSSYNRNNSRTSSNRSSRRFDPSRYLDRRGQEKEKTVNKLNEKRFFVVGDTLQNGFTLTDIDFDKATVTIVKGNERFVLGLEAGDQIKSTEQKTKIITTTKSTKNTGGGNNNRNNRNNRNNVNGARGGGAAAGGGANRPQSNNQGRSRNTNTSRSTGSSSSGRSSTGSRSR